jgi:hypothetical protein
MKKKKSKDPFLLSEQHQTAVVTAVPGALIEGNLSIP